ncbi:hypothetical protein SAMN05428970_3094 [Agromyces sp. CF514]|nr:hypothetical protein SAMN05428970_3094 [Agromyces sp. CF514]
MSSLRDELTGVTAPKVSYTLLCPPGWTKVPPAALTDEAVSAHALNAMRGAGRADLVLEFRTMLSQLKSSLRERGVFEVYVAPEREGVPMPAMIAVSPFVLPSGVTWDAALARLAKGGEVEVAPADVVMHLIRRRSEFRDASAAVKTDELMYVVPVPGGDGRRSLVFQVSVLSVDDENSAELAKGLVFACEAIMSTFAWVTAA